MLSSTFLVGLLLARGVNAFWRLPCDAPLIIERADPIVSPGHVSGHVHTVSGGSNFALTDTFAGMRASECTSCLVKQDMSAYWTPQLYFQWANGSFTSVQQVGGGLIYYLQRNHSSDTGKILAFPDGLRMLIGSPSLRSYNASNLAAQAIGWNCLGQATNPTRNPFLPSNNCPDGLRGELRFPSCWDGTNVDSTDHFSHMAYSDGESGPCPSSHPNRIVTLFYEMMWSVDPFNSVRSQALNPTQPFVLAMGDPTGYGYHGDFLNGWDGTVLQNAVDTCTAESGVIQECPVFDLYDSAATCAKTPDVNEIVLGTFSSLPGCNPVVSGPANAATCTAPTTPAIFSSPVVYTGGAPPPGSQVLANAPRVVISYNTSNFAYTYDDCYSDAASVRALPNGLATSPQTVATCLNACATKGYSLCGIEYHGECWGGNSLATTSTAIGYGNCALVCNGNSTEYCGGNNAFDLYRGTAIVTSTSVSKTTTTAKVTTTTSKASTTTTKTISSSAVASATALPGKVATNPRWKYANCSSDLVNGARSLPNTLSSNATVDGCLAACDAQRFAVCGLSYYGECYGGAALSRNSVVLPASQCTFTCTGNVLETCGGSGTLDIYLSTKVAVLTTPATPNLAAYGGWTYSNCYTDLVNNVRSLPMGLTSNATLEGCLTACAKAGATACGASYYGECWSSTTGLSSASTVLPASSCMYPCKANPNEWCGGSAALSVYFPTAKRLRVVRNQIKGW